jgi:hypothetical protein
MEVVEDEGEEEVVSGQRSSSRGAGMSDGIVDDYGDVLPDPKILHPTPHTPHPTPYTLHPDPHPAACCASGGFPRRVLRVVRVWSAQPLTFRYLISRNPPRFRI